MATPKFATVKGSSTIASSPYYIGLAERALPKNSEAVCAAVTAHLDCRKRDPAKIRKLFQEKEIRYAADDSQDAD